MHRVVKAHVADFQKKFEVSDQESKQFEAFVNYVVLRSLSADAIDPKDLVYEGADPGIDGILIFVDDCYVSSVDEVEDAFSGRRRDADATVVFTQAKTPESWSKSEINTFESAINDFLSDKHAYPHGEYMTNCREVFNAVLNNIEKFASGNDDDTVKAIKDLCASIVDIDEVTRDKLRGSSLVPDVRSKALNARQASL